MLARPGFWHPYGRGAAVPPTRVVSFSPHALAQVTLRLPSAARHRRRPGAVHRFSKPRAKLSWPARKDPVCMATA